MSQIEIITREINSEMAKPEVQAALIATTFKGLDVNTMRRAAMEGMMRGFTFKDFLEKNVYAIPYGSGYSLVTSIDYSRKMGMRGGIVGVGAPDFEEKDGKIISCSVTVKRKVQDYIGEYTAKVFFNEYSTGKSLWSTKPHTMISKVAEMHALRKACPEELSQQYIEEEFEKPVKVEVALDLDPHLKKLESVKSEAELKKVWSSLPGPVKVELKDLKETLKTRFSKEEKKDENTEVPK